LLKTRAVSLRSYGNSETFKHHQYALLTNFVKQNKMLQVFTFHKYENWSKLFKKKEE